MKTLHNQISAIFNHAVRFYELKSNPALKAGSVGKKEATEMLFWTKEEYLKFKDSMMDSRSETEWNQWVYSEKQQLAVVMERYGIEWEQKGTHKEHLTVLDYKKEQRTQEISKLEDEIEDLQAVAQEKSKKADKIEYRLEKLQNREDLINLNVGTYETDPKWQLPEPGMFTTASSYKSKIVDPFIRKLKKAIGSIVAAYLQLKSTMNNLNSQLIRAHDANNNLHNLIDRERQENKKLVEVAKDYKRVRKVLGDEQTDNIIVHAKSTEQIKKPPRNRGYER